MRIQIIVPFRVRLGKRQEIPEEDLHLLHDFFPPPLVLKFLQGFNRLRTLEEGGMKKEETLNNLLTTPAVKIITHKQLSQKLPSK